MRNWLFLFFITTQSILFSQNTELGILVGASVYTGDIGVSSKNFFPNISPAVGIMGRYHFNEKLAIRALIAIGGVKGDEKKYPVSDLLKERGLNFKGTVAELALLPEWRVFNIGNVSFFAFAGVAATYVNPKSFFNDQGSSSSNPKIIEDQNQKYPKIALSIPIGGGLQWYLNGTTALGGELGIRKTYTDYLDGFSAIANPKSKDYYAIGGITFSKFFSLGNDKSGTKRTRYQRKGVNCPSFN